MTSASPDTMRGEGEAAREVRPTVGGLPASTTTTPAEASPPTTLDTLRQTIARMVDEIADLEAEGDYVSLGHGLCSLDTLARDFSALKRETEQALARVMPSKKVELPGVVLERRKSTKRSEWQHDELLPVVLRRLLTDPETGETLPLATLNGLAERIRSVLTPSWKVTGLRDCGLDPSEWCREDEGAVSVQLHRERP